MVAAFAFASEPDDIIGLSNSEKSYARIEIYKCGVDYRYKMAGLKEPTCPAGSKDGAGALQIWTAMVLWVSGSDSQVHLLLRVSLYGHMLLFPYYAGIAWSPRRCLYDYRVGVFRHATTRGTCLVARYVNERDCFWRTMAARMAKF